MFEEGEEESGLGYALQVLAGLIAGLVASAVVMFIVFLLVMGTVGSIGGRPGQRIRRRVPENPRPQRHRLELLDRSAGAPWSGSCQRLAVENVAGSRCRCRPCPRPRRLQRLPNPLERRRPRPSHPETSQIRIRQTTVAITRSHRLSLQPSNFCNQPPGSLLQSKICNLQ